MEDPARRAGLRAAEAGLAGSAGHPTSGAANKHSAARKTRRLHEFVDN